MLTAGFEIHNYVRLVAMQFAILFIVSFLVGLGIYRISRKWVRAVLLPMGVFAVTTLLDVNAQNAWTFSLVFGLPIVFVGSLLGAYVVEIRRPEEDLDDVLTETE